jgi:hypothetical protein
MCFAIRAIVIVTVHGHKEACHFYPRSKESYTLFMSMLDAKKRHMPSKDMHVTRCPHTRLVYTARAYLGDCFAPRSTAAD